MITLTVVSAIFGTHIYKINGKEYSFTAGNLTYVTSPGEKVVNIESTEEKTRISVFPFTHDSADNDDCCHTISASIDNGPVPTIMFNGTGINSNVEFVMGSKTTITFVNKNEYVNEHVKMLRDAYQNTTPDKTKNENSANNPNDKPDCGDSIGDVDGDSDKIVITETKPEKPEKCEKSEKKPANIAEITSYDRVMNAIYDVFSENSVIDIDREMFNDICTDGISIEARNWNVSMHPYIVTFQKELCPYTRVLHLSIEKTRKYHNGIYCGMYVNRGTISLLLRFNDKGQLIQIESSFATIDSTEYCNQEIRDLFTEIEKAKSESKEKGIMLREQTTPYTSDEDNSIHC